MRCRRLGRLTRIGCSAPLARLLRCIGRRSRDSAALLGSRNWAPRMVSQSWPDSSHSFTPAVQATLVAMRRMDASNIHHRHSIGRCRVEQTTSQHHRDPHTFSEHEFGSDSAGHHYILSMNVPAAAVAGCGRAMSAAAAAASAASAMTSLMALRAGSPLVLSLGCEDAWSVMAVE